MKKLFAALGFLGLLLAIFWVPTLAPTFAQTAPSGRSIVYPLENPPSGDTVLQPARFTRLALGSLMLHGMGLTAAGQGQYANCTTAPGTGLYVTVGPTISGSDCGLYQVGQLDASPMPEDVTPQLPADPTLVVIQALQSASSNPIGPLTAPGSNSVYWLIEAQTVTSDTNVQSRPIFQPASGVFVNQSVATQRQDAIAYQTKEGTSGASPSKPSVDSGWVAVAYVLIPSGTSQVTTGMISAGSLWTGFGSGGGGGGVSSLIAGQNITLSPAGGTGNVTVGDAVTPGPQATPCPIASTGITITAPWPCTISATGGGGAWTTLPAPTSSPTGTFNPGALTAANYYLWGTANLCGGAPPCVLHFRARVKFDATVSYYGILVGSSSKFADAAVQYNGGGANALAFAEQTTSANTGSVYNNSATIPFVSGKVYIEDLWIMVSSSSMAYVTAAFDGPWFGVSGSNGTASGLSEVPITDLDFTGSLNIYCVGSSSTSCISGAYATSLGN